MTIRLLAASRCGSAIGPALVLMAMAHARSTEAWAQRLQQPAQG